MPQAAPKPAATFLGWAKVEEELGSAARVLALFERAVAAEEGNAELWGAYAAFCARTFGESSEQAREVFQRQVVAEIRHRAQREDLLAELGLDMAPAEPPGGRRGRRGRAQSPGRGDGGEDGGDEANFKAKWASGRTGSAGTGTLTRGSMGDFWGGPEGAVRL